MSYGMGYQDGHQMSIPDTSALMTRRAEKRGDALRLILEWFKSGDAPLYAHTALGPDRADGSVVSVIDLIKDALS